MGADKAGSPGLEDGILVCRGALVVGLAPDEVPEGGDNNDGRKDNGGIVHRRRCNREVCRHTE